MEESERLYRELQEIKGQLAGARKNKIVLIEDPEIQSLVLNLVVAQSLLEPGDPFLSKLQAENVEKKNLINQEERELTTRHKTISKELHNLTKVAIAKGVERISFELTPLKLEKKVLKRSSGGFSMSPKIELSTNEDAIVKVKKIIRETLETLRRMNLEAISKIEGFVSEKLAEIHGIDLNPVNKTADEFENERSAWAASPVR